MSTDLLKYLEKWQDSLQDEKMKKKKKENGWSKVLDSWQKQNLNPREESYSNTDSSEQNASFFLFLKFPSSSQLQLHPLTSSNSLSGRPLISEFYCHTGQAYALL